nr:MAG TPA: hypothetical protein [Caudoviricetes sp.]
MHHGFGGSTIYRVYVRGFHYSAFSANIPSGKPFTK